MTYEFGEQHGRIWLAQNQEVMRQDTKMLWEQHKNAHLTESQWTTIRSLYQSRQNGKLWENFSRLWQGSSSQGGERVRQELGLDARPIALLAANVIGDSLTLGRQIFSKNMTDWLERTIEFFAHSQDVQLVIRIHPGERYLKGPSVAEVARRLLPVVPEFIHLVDAQNPINTYDLIEIADLGLAYTTTVGMEMAMSGIPVVLGGETHYRSKGFTYDPSCWEDNFASTEKILRDPKSYRLSNEQVELAWNYAFRFYFEYPHPFPWHLLGFWDELETWPIQRVFSAEGLEEFGGTFEALVGEPIHSSSIMERVESLNTEIKTRSSSILRRCRLETRWRRSLPERTLRRSSASLAHIYPKMSSAGFPAFVSGREIFARCRFRSSSIP